jgi:uridine kinase
MDHGTRDELLSRLAEAVGSVAVAHPTRVAIDGPPAAGKTTLADELAVALRAQGRDVIRATIEDFGPGGDRRYRQAVYDKATDTALSEPVRTAPAGAILLFDGVFLLRQELADRWDLRIFVSVPFEKTLDRARTRDQTPSKSAAEVERRYRSRYLPSQQFYFDTARPAEHADIIVHNDDPRQPAWEART